MRSFWWRSFLGLCLLVFLFIIRRLGYFDWLTLTFIQEKAHIVLLWSKVHPLAAPALYFLIVFIATALFIPITLLATVVSGYLFGVVAGTFYTVIAVTMGSIVVAALIRLGFGLSLQIKYGNHLNGFNRELNRYGAYYILMMHILPMTPTVLINILVGFSTMSLRSFAWATAFGILPGTLIYVLIGKKLLSLTTLEQLLSWQTLGFLTLLALLVVVPMIIDRWVRAKNFIVSGDRVQD